MFTPGKGGRAIHRNLTFSFFQIFFDLSDSCVTEFETGKRPFIFYQEGAWWDLRTFHMGFVCPPPPYLVTYIFHVNPYCSSFFPITPQNHDFLGDPPSKAQIFWNAPLKSLHWTWAPPPGKKWTVPNRLFLGLKYWNISHLYANKTLVSTFYIGKINMFLRNFIYLSKKFASKPEVRHVTILFTY